VSVLETQGLTCRFGELVDVDALTISVEAGEVFTRPGANGAAKTVTMKMLTTFRAPSGWLVSRSRSRSWASPLPAPPSSLSDQTMAAGACGVACHCSGSWP
jgi:ABC-type branched-subunit amino acid transport system ATPase component